MPKHTPGPWEQDGCTIVASGLTLARTFCEALRDVEPGITCEAVPFSPSDMGDGLDEAFANASLIAAAPDLLAVLRGWLRCVDENRDQSDAIAEARDTLAKAECKEN